MPVYVRRSLGRVRAAQAVPGAGPELAVSAPGPEVRAEAPVARPVDAAPIAPRYALSFAQLGAGVLVCDRSEGPTGHFARDLALALGGGVRVPAVNNLEWPGKLPPALGADLGAACEAARGLLDGMLDGASGAVVMVLGEQAVRHLVVPALGESSTEGQAQVDGHHWYWNVGGYRMADTKRALWRFVRTFTGRS